MPIGPAGDPCRLGTVVLGPVRVDRSRGRPVEERFSFSAPEAGDACVAVRNGDAPPRRVASARVALDGAELLDPSSFNQNVARFERRLGLGAGPHDLDVQVASAPGSFLEITVRMALPFPAAAERRLSALEELRFAHCLEANLAASQLTPEEWEQAQEAAVTLGRVPGSMTVLSTSLGVPALLSPLPGEDLPGTTPGERGSAWMERHADLFEPSEDWDVAVHDVRGDGSGNDGVVFVQRFRGLPVIPGVAELWLDGATGRPLIYQGQLVPGRALPDSDVPAVAQEVALDIARAQLSPPADATEHTGLAVLDRSDSACRCTALAWHVGFDAPGLPRLAAWIDATTGEILSAGPLVDRYDPRARISRATRQACDATHQTALFLEETVLYDRSTFPPPAPSCGGDAPCETIVEAVGDTDLFLASILRAGWSGEGVARYMGLPEIPAAAPYVVIDDLRDPGGAFWSPSSTWIVLPPDFRHRDVIAHETGHGVHQVERGNTDTDSYESTTQGGIGEAMGDTLALAVQDFRGELTLELRGAEGVIRDYRERACEGYGPADRCDLHPFASDSVCGPVEGQNGCREHTHMDLFADHRLEHDDALGSGQRIREHALGCALARPFTLVLDRDRDGELFHGVQVRTLPQGPAAFLWKWTAAGASGVRNGLTWEAWGEAYARAAGKVGALCAERGDGPPCSPAVDELGAAMSGFWAAGFWSDLIHLSARAEMPGDYVASTGVAAVVTTGPLAPALWIAFGDPGAALHVASIVDPYGGARFPPSVAITVEGLADARTEDDPALAFSTADGYLYLAWREAGSNRLRVARAHLGGSFTADERFPPVPIDGAPSLAVDGTGAVTVAYRAQSTGGLWLARAAPGAPPELVTPDDADPLEHDPFVLDTPRGLMLLTSYGPAELRDTLTGEEMDIPVLSDGFFLVRSRFLLASGELSRFATLKRLPLPYGLGAPPGPGQEPAGMPLFGGFDRVGPAAASFGNRVHVFFTARAAGDLGEGVTATLSFEPEIARGAVPGTEGRTRGLSLGGRTRLAPVVFPDPARGDILLILAANDFGRIQARYRRSW